MNPIAPADLLDFEDLKHFQAIQGSLAKHSKSEDEVNHFNTLLRKSVWLTIELLFDKNPSLDRLEVTAFYSPEVYMLDHFIVRVWGHGKNKEKNDQAACAAKEL